MTLDRWMQRIPLRLRSVFRRSVVDRELDDEFQYHIERQTAEYVRRGMAPAAALEAARREIGNVAFYREASQRHARNALVRGAPWRCEIWHAEFASRADFLGGRRRHARTRHWREHRDVHVAARNAAQAAPESRRRANRVHPAVRAGEQHHGMHSFRFPRSMTCAPARKRWRRSATFLQRISRSSTRKATRRSLTPAWSAAIISTSWGSSPSSGA